LKGYTPGLEGDLCSVSLADNSKKLVAFQRRKSAAPNQVAVVIANFSGATISSYSLTFPSAGNWYVHLNSDSTNYSSDFQNIGSSVVTASGSPAQGLVTVGAYSALILSQTPDAPPQLTIQSASGAVNIGWPSSYFEWGLAASAALDGTSAWVQVPASQYQTNGTTVSITVTPLSGSFYRLERK
jgi:hypothetical protein